MLNDKLDRALRNMRQSMPRGSLLEWTVDGEALFLEKLLLPRAEQGKGQGSKWLAKFLDVADQHRMDVWLVADSTGEPGHPTQDQLVKWYRRFGFELLGPVEHGAGMKRERQAVVGWERLVSRAKQETMSLTLPRPKFK